ncbi:S8 family serine peptidase [Streptomyces sp. NPDC091268]|uniref:S8 family serine peptidase n=1 Tax=Streptomyces sp. NPDC091268 TaxID=3365979 RepID=UPI003801F3A9
MRAGTVRGALTGTTLCGLLAVCGVTAAAGLLPGAAPARAAAAGAGAVRAAAVGAEPDSLPGMTQTLPGMGQSGCRQGSDRASGRVPWAQAYLRPDAVWPLTEGEGVLVAVLGSGVDDTAGVLGERLLAGPGFHDAGPGRDCVGHGTFVAGLIAAKRGPGAGFAGMAPRARILAVTVTDAAGNTDAELLAKGIRAAADAGARVIDLAAVSPAPADSLAEAVTYATAKGALIVAPAAADTPGNKAPVYPAAYPGVLAVADSGPGGTPARPAPAGRVDLVAPGDSVLSTGPAGSGHFTASGPSYAAAEVAGAAALVLGYRPGLSVGQLVHRLESTASHPGTALPDAHLGYGFLDPVAATTTVLPEEGALPERVSVRAPLAMPEEPGDGGAHAAYAVTGAACATVLAAAGLAWVVPRGLRRGWRPGRYEQDGGGSRVDR